MEARVVFSDAMAAEFAEGIRPFIRAYVDEHRDEYEKFLKVWNERYASEQTKGDMPCN